VGGQNYYCMGGVNTVGLSTNYQWTTVWTSMAAIPTIRAFHGTSTPSLSAGIYIYGGADNVNNPTSRSDSYLVDAWSTNTAQPAVRKDGASAAVSGLSYLWGGNGVSATNYQMTPGSPSTWATKTAMTAARDFNRGSTDNSYGYSIAGGDNVGTRTTTNYQYNPSLDTWATKTAWPQTASNSPAALSISGTIYVSYGDQMVTPKNDSYVIDTWTSRASPPNGNLWFSACSGVSTLGAGFVTGGMDGLLVNHNYHSEYTPDSWTSKTVLPIVMKNGSGAEL
jgi:hypothetical protein